MYPMLDIAAISSNRMMSSCEHSKRTCCDWKLANVNLLEQAKDYEQLKKRLFNVHWDNDFTR